MSEKYFKLQELTDESLKSRALQMSLLFPDGSDVRQGDLQMEVTSTNDKKFSVTFTLRGIYLKPKTEGDGGVAVAQEPDAPIILTPSRKIIKP